MKTRCDELADNKWMATFVFPAIELAFHLLKEHNLPPSNVEVTSYCAALARCQRHLRTAFSENSGLQLTRSRKVARRHSVLYLDLDRLLNMLGVPNSDPIHV